MKAVWSASLWMAVHGLLAASASGAVVQFSMARGITAAAVLDQPGTVVGAAQWAHPGSTLNVATAEGTIPFAPGGTGGTGGVASVDQTNLASIGGIAGNTGDAAFNSVLAGFAYANAGVPLVVTLKGLTVGQAYSVQLFSTRSGSGATAYFSDPAGNKAASFGEGFDSYFLATFVADAATQQVRLSPKKATDSVVLNALVVRATGAPQKTAWRGFDIEKADAFTPAALQHAQQRFHANLIRYHIPVLGASDAALEASLQTSINDPAFVAGLDAARDLGMAVVLCLPQTDTMYQDPGNTQIQNLTSFWGAGNLDPSGDDVGSRDPSGDDVGNVHLTKLCAHWAALARICAGRPQEIWFDLLNEPIDLNDWPNYPHNWPFWAQRVINQIRAIDTTHRILIEPGPGLAQWALAFPILDDGNLVYSFHTYNPSLYTFQGITPPEPSPAPDWPGQYTQWGPGTQPIIRWDRAEIQSFVQPAADFSKRNPGIPVFVGEFSVVRWAPHAAYYLQDSMEVFEGNGWDWDYHSFLEYPGWSLEYDNVYNSSNQPATLTDRGQLTADYMQRNYEVLNVDFNSVASIGTASPTQSRFQAFNIPDSGLLQGPVAQTYGGIDPAFAPGKTVSVTLASGTTAAGTGILLGRDRGTLVVANGGYSYGSLFVNGPLYEDVVVAQGAGTALWITLAGLQPNSGYTVQFYLYDNSAPSPTAATFTNQTGVGGAASGTISFTGGYGFTSNTANDLFSVTLNATSDAQGRLIFKETLAGGISGQAELGGLRVFTMLPRSGTDFAAAIPPASAPVLTAAVSRMAQGTAGTFDLPLPLTGAAAVEPRWNGAAPGSFTLVLTFNGPVISGNASTSTGTVAGAPYCNGNTMTVGIANISPAGTLTLSYNGVISAAGGIAASGTVSVRILPGAFNGNGSVTDADVAAISSQTGKPVGTANFRADVNASGAITGADVALARAHLGTTAP